MSILNITESNKMISDLINKNKPFSIVRLGIGDETHISLEYLLTNKINTKFLDSHVNLNGVYSISNNLHDYENFCNIYLKSIENGDYIASFTFNSRNIVKIQNYFSQKYNLPQIHSRSLEPFYSIMEGEIPWTHHLKGKKTLIIHPFVESFKKQLHAKFEIFKDKKLFLDNQEFVFYKSYQTIAGNHIHKNWFETFTIMCHDIQKLDFDIALLGCGGYGLPLCNFIKTKMNKSAIYIGGGLQLLFGVMGNRWDNNEMWQQIIKENNCKFIRPSEEERCKKLKSIEGGCYW